MISVANELNQYDVNKAGLGKEVAKIYCEEDVCIKSVENLLDDSITKSMYKLTFSPQYDIIKLEINLERWEIVKCL